MNLRDWKAAFAGLLLVCGLLVGVGYGQAVVSSSSLDTVVSVGGVVGVSGVKRFGLNLGAETFWDSGMLLKNLVSRNPGFEGGTWQSILHCVGASSTVCVDDNLYTVWPAGFLAGATGEFLTGNLAGSTVSITNSTAAVSGSKGVSVSFSAAGTPAAGSYLVVRKTVPGNAQAGWWTSVSGSGAITTELSDLSPESPGTQAVRLTAAAANSAASVSSYLDTTPGRSFLQMHGSYTLSFRAKGAGGANTLLVSLVRQPASGSAVQFFSQTVALGTSWKDYSYTFSANDTGVTGPLALSFTASGSSALLDDVSLSEVGSGSNPTAFRDSVVSALGELKPGILRYMDSGTNWGSSIDNLLSVPFARVRPGYSNWNTMSQDIPIGLHEFLVLCQQVGAEPWFTLPTGMSTAEATHLMEYLGGPASSPYGAKRAALGEAQPWTSVFPRIHLEFGNEVWNTANPGATMTDPAGYSARASAIFATLKGSPYYTSPVFDLVADGWSAVPSWDQAVLANATGFDTIDIAPYLFNSFNDASSTEAIYGPMLAQPELWDSTSGGQVQAVASLAAGAGRKLSVYEVNLSTTSGTVPQSTVTGVVPSLGAGLATVDHMLLMLRDAGITEQNLFSLAGYTSVFTNPSNTGLTMTTPLWGAVVDMGNTNRRRPDFLAASLANSALLPGLLPTSQSGSNPTWNQAKSSNDNIALSGAHMIQSFAFTDGTNGRMVLLNLSRTSALPVAFSGVRAPSGTLSLSTLKSSAITDANEDANNVSVSNTSMTLASGQSLQLPPFSMTVVGWTLPPVSMTSVSCGSAQLATGATTSCTSDIATNGTVTSAVTWTASAGTVDAAGNYTAPATAPANGTVTVTATSQADPSRSASATLQVMKAGPTGITLSCSAPSVPAGTQDFCTASMTGVGSYDTSVLWSVSSGSVGSDGTVTAPASTGTITVTATSAYNTAVSKSQTLSVTAPALAISSVRFTNVTANSFTVSWNAGTASASNGVSYGPTNSYGSTTPWTSTLTANPSYTLTGLNPNTTYYLQIYSTAGGQSVTYQTTTKTSSQAATQTASQANSTSSRSISAVSCESQSVPSGGSTSCAAKVSDGSAVRWTASAGTVTAGGAYTAPSTVTTTASVTITATSVADPTKSSSATLSVVPPQVTGVSASCTPTNVAPSGTASCSATVTGTGSFSSQVTWTANSGVIDSSGKFTAPSSASTVTITATSVQTPGASGTATITVAPTSGASATLSISGITITNVTATSATVSWNSGVVSSSGVNYGTTAQYGSTTPWTPNTTNKPSFTLTNLKPNTSYFLMLYSSDSSYKSVSATASVTTAAQ